MLHGVNPLVGTLGTGMWVGLAAHYCTVMLHRMVHNRASEVSRALEIEFKVERRFGRCKASRRRNNLRV